MHKIEIPHLAFEGKEIEPPVGLSELLESAWRIGTECELTSDIVSGFERKAYKRKNGCWATKYEFKKEGNAQ